MTGGVIEIEMFMRRKSNNFFQYDSNQFPLCLLNAESEEKSLEIELPLEIVIDSWLRHSIVESILQNLSGAAIIE